MNVPLCQIGGGERNFEEKIDNLSFVWDNFKMIMLQYEYNLKISRREIKWTNVKK